MNNCEFLYIKQIKQGIDESLRKSREKGKEYGCSFCSVKENVTVSKVEEGGKDSLKIKGKCPKDAEIKGVFHAHTRDMTPSPADIMKGVEEDITVFCIGGSIDGHDIVRCFRKGDLIEEMEDIFRQLNKEIGGKEEKGKEGKEEKGKEEKGKEGKDGKKEVIKKDVAAFSKMISARMRYDKKYLNDVSCQR